MSTLEQHAELDRLVRAVQQATKDAPDKRAPELQAALERAEFANDRGVEVEAALVALQAAWAPSPVSAPAPEPEA